ncbi:MAG: cytochrome c3 family protein [Deltaproteobacteria bacterium]
MKRWLAGIGLSAFSLIAFKVGLTLSADPVPSTQQPIAFNHKIHAGDYKIACEYCHIYARRAAVAGIPSAQRCMGCHKITARANPEVRKLRSYWDRKEPIQWIQTVWMPDFVYFEHAPHIKSKIACQTCHGPVETMERLGSNKNLTMDYCVSCHRQRQASIDCAICHR